MIRIKWAMMALLLTAALGSAAPANAVEISVVTRAATGDVAGASAGPDDVAPLRARATIAAQAFERAFGPLPGTLTLAVKPVDCLRVGYDYEQDRVEFCDIAGVKNAGLSSDDVIDHELFHAMLCRARPALCTRERLKDESAVALHEALADFFAYTLEPDAAFGENFYADRAEIRTYRTDLCYSLAAGAHAKGNALVSALIARGMRLPDLAQFVQGANFTAAALLARPDQALPACFREGESSPAVRVSSDNYPDSALHRYRIEPDRPLQIALEPNAAMRDAFPGSTVEWSRGDARSADLFRAHGSDGVHFSVSAPTGATAEGSTGLKASEKMLATFRAADGGVLGTVPFYFSLTGGAPKRAPSSVREEAPTRLMPGRPYGRPGQRR